MADKDTTVKTKKSTASESGKGKNRVRFKKFVLILTVAVTIGLYGCSGPENYNADLNSAGVESGTEMQTPNDESGDLYSEDEKADETDEKSDAQGKKTDTADEKQDIADENSSGAGESASSAYTCTVSIKCDTLLEHMEEISSGVREIIPEDGIILSETEAEFDEGDSVFDVLSSVTRENKIHMEFVNTPAYGTAYIKGFANIYEFDGGDVSGWMYSVNGQFPNVGCSSYEVKSGDKIEWIYSCDLGRDIGKDI